MQHLSWCEVSQAALTANARAFKARLAPSAKLGVVVKSDAYGHGLLIASRALLAGGADWLIVNSAEEAVALRQGGIEAPIYICGNVPPFQLEQVVATGARVVVYDKETIDALNRLSGGRTVPVHLKVETGTHRQGIPLADAIALAAHIRTLPHVTLEGLTTHFADIEDSTNHTFADQQWARFEEALHALPVPVPHAANSAATILYPKTHGALVRVGIAAYGLWPSKETYAAMLQREPSGAQLGLQPALTWRARLVQVKDVPQGAFVGYGRTYRLPQSGRIAVVPIGYYEGYDRRLSNVAHVLVHGQRAQVRGRICMNMFMVDVSHIPDARAGDTATLLGKSDDEEISAEQLAAWMGTINYEVVSRIHPSIPRIGA